MLAQQILLKSTLIALVFGNLAHAEIYKTVTSDGKVVYTDNANKAYQYNNDTTQIQILDNLNSQKSQATVQSTVQTATINQPIVSATQTTVVNSDTVNQADGSPAISTPMSTSYQLTIIKPEADMVYRRPADIVVEVSTRPSLQAGDRIVYRINGKHIATTQAMTYNISSLAYMPERYTLSVEVENAKGQVIASQSRDFQLLGNNFAIQKKRKALAEAKAKQKLYDSLPWYKKIAVNLNL